MSEPSSHEPNSQKPQPEQNIQQENKGSMSSGQQAATGDSSTQVQGNYNWINSTLNISLGQGSPESRRAELNPGTDNFLGILVWIKQNSEGKSLAFLDHYYKVKLLRALFLARQEKNPDFTELEIEVLELVIDYCCFHSQGLPSKWSKFKSFRRPEDYYRGMKKLIVSEEKIRCGDICLSSLVDSYDSNLSQLVKKAEQ